MKQQDKSTRQNKSETQQNKSETQQIILAKSAMNYEQMKRKIELGADGLEIQLLGELIVSQKRFKTVEKAFPNLFELTEFPVYSIHAPLLEYTTDKNLDDSNIDIQPNIEQLVQREYVYLLEQIFRLAETFALKQNHRVNIVVHSELSYRTLKTYNSSIYKDLTTIIPKLLSKYEEVDLCIENVCPIRKIYKQTGEFQLGNNFSYDCIEMVEDLRNTLGKEYKNRLFNVLDTCHAEIAHQFVYTLHKLYPEINISEYEMYTFFKKFASTTKIVHLSITRGNGNGKGRHGQPFETFEDKQIAEYYLRELKENNFNSFYVLEVAETDYNLSDGFSKSLKIIKELL